MGAAVAALTTIFVVAFHIFRRYIPIPRGGFFCQTFVIVAAFAVAGFMAGAVGGSAEGPLAGAVALTLLAGLHIGRLYVEEWWADHHATP